MKFPALFLFSAAALLWSGCITKPVDIIIPQAESKLVVATQVVLLPGIDTSLIVNLTRSFSSLSSGDNSSELSSSLLANILVDSALVTISYRNQTDTLLWLGDTTGTYTSTKTPLLENEVYTLYAKDRKTGQEIRATSTLLPRVMLKSATPKVVVNFEKNPLISGLVDTTYLAKIAINFEDIPSVENYYMLNVYSTSRTNDSSKGNSNPLLGSQNAGNTLLLSDKLFASLNHIDTMVYTLNKALFQKNPNASDTLIVTLSNINRTYYDFLQKRNKASSSLITQLLGEPINYPTNVVNGYGFFNTHAPSAWVVIAKQ